MTAPFSHRLGPGVFRRSRRDRYDLAVRLHAAGHPGIRADWDETVILTDQAYDDVRAWQQLRLPYETKAALIGGRVPYSPGLADLDPDGLATLIALNRDSIR